jgi:hypothetical protein
VRRPPGTSVQPAWMRAPGTPVARALVAPALILACAFGIASSLRPRPMAAPAELREAMRTWDGGALPLPEVRSASPDVARQQAVLRGVALELRSLDAAPPGQRALRHARALTRLEEMSDAP